MSEQRLTQAERRAKTQRAVLASACRLFGANGYSATSLENIANDCGLTTRPIYHYFGNKKALFTAVNEDTEQRILAVIATTGKHSAADAWSRFLDLCEDPAFRQIVLIDSPNILGRARWQSSNVMQAVVAQTQARLSNKPRPTDPSGYFRQELQLRMTISALAEAAMMVAEAEDVIMARRQAEHVVRQFYYRSTNHYAGNPAHRPLR